MRSMPKPTHAECAVPPPAADDLERHGQVVEVAVARGDRGRLLLARHRRRAARTSARARAGSRRASSRRDRRTGRWRRRRRPASPRSSIICWDRSSQSSRNASARVGRADVHELVLVERLHPRRVVATARGGSTCRARRTAARPRAARRSPSGRSGSRPPAGARDRSARARRPVGAAGDVSQQRRVLGVAAVEAVDRARRGRGTSAGSRCARGSSRETTAGNRKTSGRSTAPGLGHEAVDAVERRDEARRPCRRRPSRRTGQDPGREQRVPEGNLALARDARHQSPLWISSIWAFAPRMRSLFTIRAAPYASRRCRVSESVGVVPVAGHAADRHRLADDLDDERRGRRLQRVHPDREAHALEEPRAVERELVLRRRGRARAARNSS